MSRSHANVEKAIGTMIDFVRSSGSSFPLLEASSVDLYKSIATFPDDTILTRLVPGEYVPPENCVIVETSDELKYAVDALGEQLDNRVPPTYITSQVVHEKQHALGWGKLPVERVRFGINLTGIATDQHTFDWQPFSVGEGETRQYTKLDLASVIAAPLILSPGDKARIIDMGYSGIPDVGNRIVTQNLTGDYPKISVPLSFLYRQANSRL
jgi:hypothetical protein